MHLDYDLSGLLYQWPDPVLERLGGLMGLFLHKKGRDMGGGGAKSEGRLFLTPIKRGDDFQALHFSTKRGGGGCAPP